LALKLFGCHFVKSIDVLVGCDGGCGEEHNCGYRSDKADTDDAPVVVGDNARGDDAPNARYKDNSTHDANAL
jgi:hypothetical protein